MPSQQGAFFFRLANNATRKVFIGDITFTKKGIYQNNYSILERYYIECLFKNEKMNKFPQPLYLAAKDPLCCDNLYKLKKEIGCLELNQAVFGWRS
jgi:hypothetical protein